MEKGKNEYEEEVGNCRKVGNEGGFGREKGKVEESNVWRVNKNRMERDGEKMFER